MIDLGRRPERIDLERNQGTTDLGNDQEMIEILFEMTETDFRREISLETESDLVKTDLEREKTLFIEMIDLEKCLEKIVTDSKMTAQEMKVDLVTGHETKVGSVTDLAGKMIDQS